MKRDLFREDDGFSTVGMVVASWSRFRFFFRQHGVYRVSSASPTAPNTCDFMPMPNSGVEFQRGP